MRKAVGGSTAAARAERQWRRINSGERRKMANRPRAITRGRAPVNGVRQRSR